MKKKFTTFIISVVLVFSFICSVTAYAAGTAYEKPNQKLIALTIDDGPCDYFEDILNILQQHDVKATFFLGGAYLDKYSEVIRRAAGEGHQIANHSMTHPDLRTLTDAEIEQEVQTCAKKLAQITGFPGTDNGPYYFRPPYGYRDERVLKAINAPAILWSINSYDWQDFDSDKFFSIITEKAQDGDIILMHQTVESSVRALDDVIIALKAQGFEFVTVEDLFWRRGITPQNGVEYRSVPYTTVNRCAKSEYFDETKLDNHWAAKEIKYVKDNGIMSGNQYGEFMPNFPLTRAMFVTILGRYEGIEAKEADTGFLDVDVHYYAAPYIAWAKEVKIMEGVGNNMFNPDAKLTRLEMATVLSRYLHWKGVSKSYMTYGYMDDNLIQPWAKDAVIYCSGLRILEGATNGYFYPYNVTTRAMGAKVMYKINNLVGTPEAETTAISS